MAGTQLLGQVAVDQPGLHKARADGGYRKHFIAMIHLAMTDLTARRLTGENTVSWRDPTSAARGGRVQRPYAQEGVSRA